MTRSTELRELARRLARVTPTPVRTRSVQSLCTIIVRDYQPLACNNMTAAKPGFLPFLCSMEPNYRHPIGQRLYPHKKITVYGSSFPVAPNILLTAGHAVYDETLKSAGYEISLIESYQPHFSNKSLYCEVIPHVSKSEVTENDPVTEEPWMLPKDYVFLRVQQSVPHWANVLIPQAAREGDSIVFPALRPDLTEDFSLVDDTLFALLKAFKYGGLSEKEAEERVKKLHIDSSTLERFAGIANTIQSEGKVLRVAHGLIAHDSPFLRGMSGTFGSVAPGTFSCVGISAGMGAISPGTNYNVAVDINRADFREDYEAIVLPNLPHEARLQAEKFLRQK